MTKKPTLPYDVSGKMLFCLVWKVYFLQTLIVFVSLHKTESTECYNAFCRKHCLIYQLQTNRHLQLT